MSCGQPLNEAPLIDVRFLPKRTSLRLGQLKKAWVSMAVRLSGRVTEMSALQFIKACDAMTVTPSGMTASVMAVSTPTTYGLISPFSPVRSWK